MWPNRLLACVGAILLTSPPVSSYKALSDESLRSITIPQGQFDIHSGGLLAPILIPRVSGSEGNLKVQNYFFDFAREHLPGWTLSTQNSTSKTPVTGDRDVPFTNVIMKKTPPWAAEEEVSYLTLVAHFDSKYEPDGFIGATDSAAPCAMILHAAQSLDKLLDAKWQTMQAQGIDDMDSETKVGLQVLMLDGEEAFLHWSDTDSLYGARSLAEEWEREAHAIDHLGSISLFVLLDLLGAANPRIPSYFPTTHWAYVKMAEIETRLRDSKLFASSSDQAIFHEKSKNVHLSNQRWLGGMVSDDHLPFMHRGVEILHLITNPFPRVWHTMDDDGAHLDIPTVEDWAKIVTAFTAEWMELEGFMTAAQRRNDKTEL